MDGINVNPLTPNYNPNERTATLCQHLVGGQRKIYKRIYYNENYISLCMACYGEIVVQVFEDLGINRFKAFVDKDDWKLVTGKQNE